MTTIFFFKWSVRNRFLHFLLDSNDDDDSATIRYTSVFVYCEKKEKCIFQQDDVRMSLSIVPHSKSCMKNVLFILFSVEKERWKKKLQRESNKVSGVSKRLSPVVTT